MENLRKEIAKYAGNEDILNTICQIENVVECEIDSEGRIWINDDVLSDERTISVWEHPLMNE